LPNKKEYIDTREPFHFTYTIEMVLYKEAAETLEIVSLRENEISV
jgi:hypothetical protein